jgi:hypothetical protein
MGYSVPTGLLAATIDRGVMLCVTLVLGAIGYAITLPRLRRASAAATELAKDTAEVKRSKPRLPSAGPPP